MALTIEIVTPAKKIFSGPADSVVLPTSEGQINVLPGHIPLTALVEPGEIIVINGTKEERLVVDKGFVRVLGDTVSILTEAAIDEDEIDLTSVESAEKRAEIALAEARTRQDIDPAEIEKMEQVLRFAVVQKLVKRPGSGH